MLFTAEILKTLLDCLQPRQAVLDVFPEAVEQFEKMILQSYLAYASNLASFFREELYIPLYFV